jgi:hypothetical protein
MVEMIKDTMDLRRNLIFLPLRILAAFVDALAFTKAETSTRTGGITAILDQVKRDRNPSIAFKTSGSG